MAETICLTLHGVTNAADDEVNDDGEGSKNQMTADKRLEIKCDHPPRNESEVPSGCLELERKMGVGGVRYRF